MKRPLILNCLQTCLRFVCSLPAVLSVWEKSQWFPKQRKSEGHSNDITSKESLSINSLYIYLKFTKQQKTPNKRALTRADECLLILSLFGVIANVLVRVVLNSVQVAGRSRLAGLAQIGPPWRVCRRMGAMSAPLVPGQPRRSEFGAGVGQFVHPDSDYQSQRKELYAPVDKATLRDDLRKFQADKRTDPTDVTSGGYDDNIFLAGNPDTFGPGRPLVQADVELPTGTYPQPVFRSGVTRQE